MGIVVDILVCAIFVMAIVSGATKGLVKQLSSLLRGIVAFAGSIVLTALIINILRPTGLYQAFVEIATSWFKGDTMVIVVNSPDELAIVLSQHNSLKILAGLSQVLYNDMQALTTEALPCNTMGELLGHHVADLIVGFVLWILLLLLLRLMFKGLIGLMKEIIIMPAFKTLDRILGAVWVLAFTYIILIGIVFAGIEALIIMFAPDTWIGFEEFLRGTTVLVWIHDTNVIGQLIAGLLNVTLPSINVAPMA